MDFPRYLSYSPETGRLTWIRSTCDRIKAGDEAGPKPSKTTGYKYVGIFGKQYAAHRVAFFLMEGRWPKNEIDHINRVRDDNRWSNLREATRVENARNIKMHRRNTSGVTGVSKNPHTGYWHARMWGKYLGSSLDFDVAVGLRRDAEHNCVLPTPH